MSVLSKVLLDKNVGYAIGHNAAMTNLSQGGMMGHSPDFTQWVSNQKYIRRNIICLLVQAPKGFAKLPNGDEYVKTLRALVELHPMSIEGLNAGLEVEIASSAVGGAGQQHDDFTDVKETQSQIVFKWDEKIGMPIANFLRSWIINLMMNPYTKFADLATLGGVEDKDQLADSYSATMIFIEPDALHNKVVKSWLVTNMFPKKTGDITGRRDLTAASEATSYDIDFTGIAQFGVGVDVFAQKLLDEIKITGASPYMRPAFVDAISADVLAAKNSYGQNVQELANTSLKV
jgi:hypothetical protein